MIKTRIILFSATLALLGSACGITAKEALPPPTSGGTFDIEAVVASERFEASWQYQPSKPYVILVEQCSHHVAEKIVRTPIPPSAGSTTTTFVLDRDYSSRHPEVASAWTPWSWQEGNAVIPEMRFVLKTAWDQSGWASFSLSAKVGAISSLIEGLGTGGVFSKDERYLWPIPLFFVDRVTKTEGKVGWFSWWYGLRSRHLPDIQRYWTETQADGRRVVFNEDYFKASLGEEGRFIPLGELVTVGTPGHEAGLEVTTEPLTPSAAEQALRAEDWKFAGTFQPWAEPTAFYAFSSNSARAGKLRYKLQIQPGLARTILWAETFTPEGAAEPADYRFVSEEVEAEAVETSVHEIDPFQRFGSRPGIYRILALEAELFNATLTADVNRDGALLPAGGALTDYVIANADAATAARPYVQLFNGDDDNDDGQVDHADAVVNGVDDVADFFPVFLNIKQLLTTFPPGSGAVFRLSQADSAVSFVYTDLTRANAFSYLNDERDYGYGPELDQPLARATVIPVTAAGVELSVDFLYRIRDQGRGGILVEARAASSAPLVLTVETATGTAVVRLPLQAIAASLAVDANRDGEIRLPSEDSSDRTSSSTPFRFWFNDDNDMDGALGANESNGNDIPGQIQNISSPDAESRGIGADYSTSAGGDGVVDGMRDLLDLFPVYLDLKQLLTVLPTTTPGVKYKLKQADGALNFVYTKMTRAQAFDYRRQLLTTGFGDLFDKQPGEASTHRITAEGYELSAAFLTGIKDNDWGVILVEGRAATTAPLFLVMEKNGTAIAEAKLEIKISSVEQMFRHVNLTSSATNYNGSTLTPPASAQPTATGEPAGWPDSQTNGKYFVFVHGYNVDGQKARGWNCEVFKRLHVLGSKARFVGVTWHGATGLDYHKAVYQAFQTGDVLKAALNFTGSADVTIAAHSLGNMVVSHAIQSGGYSPSRYYMINAAVPIEAYDLANVDTAQRAAMVEDDWKSRPARFYAANWHELFSATPTDRRNELSWKNRFARVTQQFSVFNFYSPGEDVVANVPETDTAAVGATLLNQGFNFARGAWKAQELVKGVNWTTSLAAAFMERGQGGWDSDLAYLFTSHASITNEQLKTRPFFDEFKEDDLINADPAIASTKAGETKVQYDLLARGLPALSYAAAANLVPALGADRNFNMETEGRTQNQWPSEGHATTTTENRWLHSDFKDAALPYVYQMYDAMIVKGSLK